MCDYCGKKEDKTIPPYNEKEDKGPYIYSIFAVNDEKNIFVLKSDIRIVSSNDSIFKQIRDFKKEHLVEYGIVRIDDDSNYDYILEKDIIK